MAVKDNNITFVFDLDQTLINSDHRCNFSPEGQVDLKYWLLNHTEVNVMKDTLLPLASFAQKLSKICQSHNSWRIVASTARIMKPFDMQYLKLHGLVFNAIYSRNAIDFSSSDALKKGHIDKELSLFKHNKIIFFEDNKQVLEMASKYNCIDVVDSIKLNKMIFSEKMSYCDILVFLGILD